MRSLKFVTVVFALLGLGVTQTSATRQVAIIGAGPAGASAAYHLQQYANSSGISVNITIFEKTDRIGGRSITIDPYGDASQRVELGASIFIQANHILYGAMLEFGLSPKVPDSTLDPTLGIWDGDTFVFTLDERYPSWWNTIKGALKYGITAPRRTQDLVATTLANFLRLYQAPFFPFRSLTQTVDDLGLDDMTGVNATQMLPAKNIDARYAHDLIQASTRVNFASNLDNIHGLAAVLSLAAEGAFAVQDGNWQIFQKMVKTSGATVALGTSVISIDFHKPSGQVGNPPQYTIRANSSGSPNNIHPVAFDKVIIANPYQFSGISAAGGVIPNAVEQVPYVPLHVTIFSSEKRLNSVYFSRPGWMPVPSTVLTTLAKTDNANSGAQGVGKAGFFSISTLRTAANPTNQKKEYIYKIFSPEIVTPTLLSALLGATVPSTFTGGTSPISWYHPHVFHSYPKTTPRTTFQEPVIGPGLYYTSGMEPFISTMETSALMGKNVARILVDDILAVS